MAALGTAANAAVLNWLLGGGTQAANVATGTAYVELANGSPTAAAASAIASGTVASRQQASFGSVAAGAPATASNSAIMNFTMLSGATVAGLTIWNANGPNGVGTGTMLAYGTLLTARTLLAGDVLTFAAGSCQVTLS